MEESKSQPPEDKKVVHPVSVILDAVNLAQKRGAYNMEEVGLISQAWAIVNKDYMEFKNSQQKDTDAANKASSEPKKDD